MLKSINPSNVGWLEHKLNADELKHLWKCVDEHINDAKPQLIGHVDRSINIKDIDDLFLFNTINPLINQFNKTFQYKHENIYKEHPYFLKDFWVNYQHQHEYQPIHNHGGGYSFVIWLKIPTDYEEQNKDNTANFKLNGVFEFQYLNILGESCMYRYQLTKKDEGTMLFFPSRLLHAVYPYYNCEEERVSISGNVWLNTDISR
tara:strand:- start:12950 stop:13558 length:609 start_codon:yes stop_codon:yes gene_type:complete